jgi:hypothetical protein
MTNRKFSRKRLGRALGLLTLGLAFLLAGHSATATSGAHPDSETPGSRFLVLFSPSYEETMKQKEVEAVARVAVDHNYYPLYFLNVPPPSGSAHPPGYTGYIRATADSFKDILDGSFVSPGILVVVGHGDTDLLLVESQPDEHACNSRISEYVQGGVFADGELRCVQSIVEPNPWGIAITMPAIRKYFRDNNTIVHISACRSWSLADAFKTARDFFGFDRNCPGNEALSATQKLWGRLHGEIENGRMRPTTVAGRGLGFGLLHQHRANTLDTVLSPAVRKHSPEKDAIFVVPITIKGYVDFDTRMNTDKKPATILKVEGCNAEVKYPENWSSDFRFDFELKLNTPGEATLTVLQATATAGKRAFKNNLDGNTRWRDGWGDIQENRDGGQDHTGPNRDDFVWKIKCVEKKGTSFNFTVPVGTGGTCKAKTPALGSIQISEIWATLTNCKTGQPLPEGTPVTFTVNLKPGKEKPEHISDIESITVSAPGFKPKEIKGPFSAVKVSIPGLIPITIQVINLGTVCLEPQ